MNQYFSSDKDYFHNLHLRLFCFIAKSDFLFYQNKESKSTWHNFVKFNFILIQLNYFLNPFYEVWYCCLKFFSWWKAVSRKIKLKNELILALAGNHFPYRDLYIQRYIFQTATNHQAVIDHRYTQKRYCKYFQM